MLIRYYGHFGIENGYGRAAAELALALAKVPEIELEVVPITTPPAPLDDDVRLAPLEVRLRRTRAMWDATDINPPTENPDVVLVHELPLRAPELLEREDLVGHPRLILYTTWDGASLPQAVRDALEPYRQIWTTGPLAWPELPGFSPQVTPRLRFVPHAFDAERDLPVRETGYEERFRFYWIGAWVPRKNPAGLIRAYAAAFSPGDHVELVMVSKTTQRTFFEAMAQTGLEQDQLPMVTLVNHELADAQIWGLHANADCYVTATRGEAWDLPCFEAALSGRMIITPKTGSWRYLVNLNHPMVLSTRVELCGANVVVDESRTPNGHLIGYQMRTTTPHGMSCRDLWREPSLVEISAAMRRVYEDRNRTATWNTPPATLFGHDAVAATALEYLREALR